MIDLKSKNMKELREIAKQCGLHGVRAESTEALRTRITFVMVPGLLDEINESQKPRVKSEEMKDVTPIKWLRPSEVMEALGPIKSKLQIAFYDAENNPSTTSAVTWHVKNGPAEDSGSLSCSLKWIKIKASEIANARFPAKIQRSGTDLDGALGV